MSERSTPGGNTSAVLHHDWDSIQSIKVRFCLLEKQLPYQSRIVSLQRFENLAPAYLALNPAGLVPTLVHGADVITESSIINEYADEVGAGLSLMPASPSARARVRMWARYEDEVMHPAVRPPTFHLMIKQRYTAMTQEELAALVASHPLPNRAQAYRTMATGPIDYDAIINSVAVFKEILQRMERALERNTWLACDTFSLADVAAAAFADRVASFGMAFLWTPLPRVQDWVQRLQSRPAWRAAVPPVGKRLPRPDVNALQEIRRRLAL
ncbi:MAG: glutathione S-transferase family protein [Burkholderiales bacterium]